LPAGREMVMPGDNVQMEEAEKQAKLTQQKKAELSASATIAAEKRATTRISAGSAKSGSTATPKTSPTRVIRK
ncbi:MAG: hypothetical protein ACE14V_16775, partial [bacterium]